MAYFAASCDDEKTNEEFAKSLDLDFPILSDPSREAALAYGLVKNEKGMPARRTFYIGKDGKILFIDSSVKARNHGADVAAKLEELGVDKSEG